MGNMPNDKCLCGNNRYKQFTALVDWRDIGENKETTYWEWFCTSCGKKNYGAGRSADGKVLKSYDRYLDGRGIMGWHYQK